MMLFERLTFKSARSGGWPALLTVVAGLLLLALGVQSARLLLALVTPAGAIGSPSVTSGSPAANVIAARFDPFFSQTGPAATGVVTSLPLKLFGTRIDFASGRGSAIIATPDGIQSSFSVGETIQPGIKLLFVAGDFIELERGGVKERLYLDQSVPAATAAPAGTPAPVLPPAVNASPPALPSALPAPPPPAPVTQVQQTAPSGASEQQKP